MFKVSWEALGGLLRVEEAAFASPALGTLPGVAAGGPQVALRAGGPQCSPVGGAPMSPKSTCTCGAPTYASELPTAILKLSTLFVGTILKVLAGFLNATENYKMVRTALKWLLQIVQSPLKAICGHHFRCCRSLQGGCG